MGEFVEDERDVVVELSEISKRWPMRRTAFRRIVSPERQVLSNVSLTVRRGTIFVLLGENGAGKTTLLKIIAGLAHEDSGWVSLFGETDIGSLDALRKTRLCYSGGERGFYFRLTVRENLTFFANLDGYRGSDRHMRVAAACMVTHLSDDIDRRFGDLSSGLRQRVAIARALLGDAELLLFDEPTRTLDPLHAAHIRSFMRGTLVKGQGKTIIVATNNLQEAEQLGDAVSVIRDTQLFTLAIGSDGARRLSAEEIFAPTGSDF